MLFKRCHNSCLRFKVAPRVEKIEFFRKGWNFANRTYFASCIMGKHYFLLWTKETAYFPYFLSWNYFLQRWAFLIAQSTLNFTWTSLYFKDKYKWNIKGAIFELRSSHFFRDQPYKKALEVKCQSCSFTRVLSFTSVSEDFGHILPTCFLQNFS